MNTLKSNESRRLVVEGLVIRILNGCGLKSSPVFNMPWELNIQPLREWCMYKTVRMRVKYQSNGKFFSIDRDSIENTSSALWAEVFSDSIWLARICDFRNFVSVINPLNVINKNEYYNKDEIMTIFHRIDKMKIVELRDKIKQLCSVKY